MSQTCAEPAVPTLAHPAPMQRSEWMPQPSEGRRVLQDLLFSKSFQAAL